MCSPINEVMPALRGGFRWETLSPLLHNVPHEWLHSTEGAPAQLLRVGHAQYVTTAPELHVAAIWWLLEAHAAHFFITGVGAAGDG